MLQQGLMRGEMVAIDPNMVTVFQQIHRILCDEQIDWVLTGSMAFAMQGLPFAPNDIDVQTDSKGAYALGSALASFAVIPVFERRDSPLVRSHFGQFKVDGVTIEVMGDMQKRAFDGTWDPPPSISTMRRFVIFHGMRVPVMPLDYEADSYQKMHRPEKASTLALWASRQC